MDSDKRMFLRQDLEAAGLNETEIENELFEFDRRQEYPLEDIYEEIEKIVNHFMFGLNYEYDKINSHNERYDILRCSVCKQSEVVDSNMRRGKEVERMKTFKHASNCEILKLRSLVNTLGDMIA